MARIRGGASRLNVNSRLDQGAPLSQTHAPLAD
jgi:hypothetical protein